MMRAHQIDTGHRLQLARAHVQEDLGMRKRFEPRAESGLRLPNPFRDGTDPSAVEGVQVEHAVRLAQAKRAQDHGLGPIRASPGHGFPV